MKAYKNEIKAISAQHEIDRAKVDAIIEAIENGAEMPLPVVVEDTGNGAIVIDGHHRLIAGLEFGPVECWVVPMDDFELVVSAEFEGDIPSRLSDLDQYIEINGAVYTRD